MFPGSVSLCVAIFSKSGHALVVFRSSAGRIDGLIHVDQNSFCALISCTTTVPSSTRIYLNGPTSPLLLVRYTYTSEQEGCL